MSLVALIPAKSLADAKSRLGPSTNADERAAVSLEMLRALLRQVRQVAELTTVVSDDQAILAEAKAQGVKSVPEVEPGLNHALEAARHWALREGASALLVVLSDLPLATAADLRELTARQEPVVLAPSKDGGTNALQLRPPDAIPFRFGRESARYHRFEAAKRGLEVALVERERLAFDVDTPADLQAYRDIQAGRLTLTDILAAAER